VKEVKEEEVVEEEEEEEEEEEAVARPVTLECERCVVVERCLFCALAYFFNDAVGRLWLFGTFFVFVTEWTRAGDGWVGSGCDDDDDDDDEGNEDDDDDDDGGDDEDDDDFGGDGGGGGGKGGDDDGPLDASKDNEDEDV
jgi:hypothetical protein